MRRASTSVKPAASSRVRYWGGSALSAFGDDQHVEGLHLGGDGAGVVFVEEGFGDEQSSAGRKGGVDSGEQAVDLCFAPIVEDAADGVEIGFREGVLEEVAGESGEAGGGTRGLDVGEGVIHRGGQVKDGSAEVAVALAGGDGQMAGSAPEVDQVAEAVEVEDANDFG